MELHRKEERNTIGFISDLETDKFDIIVIKSQDRLMRNTKDWYLFLDRLQRNKNGFYIYLKGNFTPLMMRADNRYKGNPCGRIQP